MPNCADPFTCINVQSPTTEIWCTIPDRRALITPVYTSFILEVSYSLLFLYILQEVRI